MRNAGDNRHGFQNEENIVAELNNKRIGELNLNLKKFIQYICCCKDVEHNENTLIKSRLEEDTHKKEDLYIEIDGLEYGVSVKMGTGNSTHQEKCEEFVTFAKEELEATEELCDDIREFVWADGTTDGTGKLEDRMSKKEYKKRCPEAIDRIKSFVDDNKEKLIYRSLFEGIHNSHVDFVYHGTPRTGTWSSAETIVDYQLSNPKNDSRALFPVGRMTIQVWNRSLNGQNDHKRGEIQFKYSSMEEDFANVMNAVTSNIGTFEGDVEEYNLSRVMNKNKRHKYWEEIGHKNDNQKMFLVIVNGNKFSKLARRKVKVKSDAYVIEANINAQTLLNKEYILNESDLDKSEYMVVENTGISIKMRESKSFTYEKLSMNSFVRLFEPYLDDAKLHFCGLTLYQEEDKLEINNRIIEDIGIEKGSLEKYYKKALNIQDISIFNSESVKRIKKYSDDMVREVIDNVLEVRNIIFTGKGCFESPYYISYILKRGELSDVVIPDRYKITNGSGRSKGKYTIIIKP